MTSSIPRVGPGRNAAGLRTPIGAGAGGLSRGDGSARLDRASRSLRLAFVAPPPAAEDALHLIEQLRQRYGRVSIDAADVLVAVGGNSAVLRALHGDLEGTPIYGLSLADADFLTNAPDGENLPHRVAHAEAVVVRALHMTCITRTGRTYEALAYNDVVLFRASSRMVRLTVEVNGRTRVEDLFSDGVLIATPMGSTAYNRSAHGPVLPLDSKTIVLTPLAPNRPRLSSTVLHDRVEVAMRIQEPATRPATLTADFQEFADPQEVTVKLHSRLRRTLLFDKGKGLHDRQIAEQF